MTNPVPKLRYLINLLLTPGMDFKATNLEYDTHKFITKENIETYLDEKFLEAKHSKIINLIMGMLLLFFIGLIMNALE